MCGRYALSLAPSRVRQRLEDLDMPVDEAPEDDDHEIRQTFNFAPGYHGLVYRALSQAKPLQGGDGDGLQDTDESPPHKKLKVCGAHAGGQFFDNKPVDSDKHLRHRLQAAKWGLIPSWTKRPPNYSSQLRTINCRDDSLIENRGMWNTMKQRKRCVVIAEGFYEWLKKNDGKEKLPHYVKRKDGQLMCFAGLWDKVTYEGSQDELFTYTIITTDSNAQLKFLHDRMPVILDAGSKAMETWLNPSTTSWCSELQNILKPYEGALACDQVDKAVGKVGNNSPSLIIPIDSKDNKKNIMNFFANEENRHVEDTDESNVTSSRNTGKRDNTSTQTPQHRPIIKTEINNSQTSNFSGSLVKRDDKQLACDDLSVDIPLKRKQSGTTPATPEVKHNVDQGFDRSDHKARNAPTNQKSTTLPHEQRGKEKITDFFSQQR